MRRFLIAGIAALAVAVVPGLASASHSGGNGPNYDKTNGTGETAQAGKVHVNAKSVGGGPAGRGSFSVKNSPFALNADVRGDVICHRAGFLGDPNESATVGVIRRSSNPVLVGAAVVIWIEDEGEPGAGQDRLLLGGLASPPPQSFCDLEPPGKLTIVQGDFVVHDGA